MNLAKEQARMMALLMDEAAANISQLLDTEKAEEIQLRQHLPDELNGSAIMLREAFGLPIRDSYEDTVSERQGQSSTGNVYTPTEFSKFDSVVNGLRRGTIMLITSSSEDIRTRLYDNFVQNMNAIGIRMDHGPIEEQAGCLHAKDELIVLACDDKTKLLDVVKTGKQYAKANNCTFVVLVLGHVMRNVIERLDYWWTVSDSPLTISQLKSRHGHLPPFRIEIPTSHEESM